MQVGFDAMKGCHVRLSALVEMSGGGLDPVGPLAADPRVAAVITTDLLDPRRYLSGGELVLTGLAWWQPDRPGRSRGFVAALVGGGAVGLAAGEAQLGSVPDDLVVACAEAGLPLLRVPVAHSFAAVTDRATRQLSGRDDLGAVLARHRALIAAIASRQAGSSGLDGVLDLVRADLDLTCWVLSPSGRPVAGSPPLAQPDRRALAREFLRARHLPLRVVRPSGQVFSLLLAGPPAAARATSWLLAVAGDHTEWTAERHTVATELASLVALEVELSRRRPEPDRHLVAALRATSSAEVERACVSCGIEPSRPCVLVVATGPLAHVVLSEALATPQSHSDPDSEPPRPATSPDSELPRPATSPDSKPPRPATSPDSELSRPAPDSVLVAAFDEVAGELIAVIQEPAGLVGQTVPVPRAAERRGVAESGDVHPGGVPEPVGIIGQLRAVLAALAPGLGPEPLRIGVSDPVTGGAGLLGAVAEARAAAMTADLATPHSVAGPDRLSSHALLLAAVPAELRQAYRARVLGPLLEHDQLHHTDLVRTLRMYLESSGSWSRCAGAMHIHVNTLRYRIDRISALTGRDLRRLEDQTDLLLALNLPQ